MPSLKKEKLVFEKEYDIKSGTFGRVSGAILKYQGNDAELVKLSKRPIVIKRFMRDELDEDTKVGPELLTAITHNPKLAGKLCGSRVEYEDNKPILMGEKVYWCINSQGESESADMQTFYRKVAALNSDPQPIVDSEVTSFQAFTGNNAGISLCRMGLAVTDAQNALHHCGYIHSDSAPRNYLMKPDLTVAVTDYGTTRQIPKNGVSVSPPGASLPIRYLDLRAMEGEVTIMTDIIQRKITMLEGVGHLVGANIHEDGKTNLQIIEERMKYAADREKEGYDHLQAAKMADEHYLKQLYARMNRNAAVQGNPSIKHYMETHKEYFTTMPEYHQTYELDRLRSVSQEDHKRLLQARDKFCQKMGSVNVPENERAALHNRLQALKSFQAPTLQPSTYIQAKSLQTESMIKTLSDVLAQNKYWRNQGFIPFKMPTGISEINKILESKAAYWTPGLKWAEIQKIAKNNIGTAVKASTRELYQAIIDNKPSQMEYILAKITGQANLFGEFQRTAARQEVMNDRVMPQQNDLEASQPTVASQVVTGDRAVQPEGAEEQIYNDPGQIQTQSTSETTEDVSETEDTSEREEAETSSDPAPAAAEDETITYENIPDNRRRGP